MFFKLNQLFIAIISIYLTLVSTATLAQTPKNQMQQRTINAQQAASIAIKHMEGGQVIDIDYEYDDGQRYYDVTLIKERVQYEVRINAINGRIIHIEIDD